MDLETLETLEGGDTQSESLQAIAFILSQGGFFSGKSLLSSFMNAAVLVLQDTRLETGHINSSHLETQYTDSETHSEPAQGKQLNISK